MNEPEVSRTALNDFVIRLYALAEQAEDEVGFFAGANALCASLVRSGSAYLEPQFAMHIEAAVAMRRRLQASTLDREVIAAGMDVLPYGVLVAEQNGKLRILNRAAAELLEENDGLGMDEASVLMGSTPELTAWLHSLLRHGHSGTEVLRLSARGCPTELGEDMAPDAPTHIEASFMFRVARPSGRGDLELLLLPFHSATTLLFSPRSLVTLFVVDPERQPEAVEGHLRSLYGLTEAQSRVCMALMQGKTPAEIAEAQGSSLHTVRSHIREILLKTGTQRQIDLVRRISGSVVCLG